MPFAKLASDLQPGIREAAALIQPFIRRTPVIEAAGAEFGLEGIHLALKLELLQHSGSFKARGAFANLLLRAIAPAGVVAASGGNHGAAVAYCAHRLGVPATIFVPRVCSAAKLARIRSYGAELVITGDRYDDALRASMAWAAESEATIIHAYDQEATLLGQGTLALELEQQAPKLDTVLVAVGGGGLIGGVASWYRGRVRVIAVEPEGAPTLHMAMQAGQPVDAPAGSIAADSLAPRQVGQLMFPIAQSFVDRVVLVSDQAILEAQARLWHAMRVVAEPGGATALAALLAGAYVPEPGERVGVIVCGGNTTMEDFSRALQ